MQGDEGPETVALVMLFCGAVKPLWFAASLSLRLDEVENSDFVQFFLQFLCMANDGAILVFLTTLYCIWE